MKLHGKTILRFSHNCFSWVFTAVRKGVLTDSHFHRICLLSLGVFGGPSLFTFAEATLVVHLLRSMY